MGTFRETAWKLAGICREAVNQQVYGGDAPHDSNILSETWPTAAGAAFAGECDGQKFTVLVMPVPLTPGRDRTWYPDYSS